MDKCENFKKEIKKGLTEKLKQHLEECRDCYEFYSTYTEFKNSILDYSLPEPSEDLISECRTKLHYSLIHGVSKREESFFRRFRGL